MKPLWRCPTCGQTFVTVNMPHSCAVRSPEDHFGGIDRWLEEARDVGDQRHVTDPDWPKVRHA